MAAEKSPAFQFYPREFLSDGNVSGMSLHERGAYITLICICWNDGSLPTATERLANMVGTPHRQFLKFWPVIRACFVERDGRYVHPRLEREREKQDIYRRRQSDRGAAGADKRWRKHGASMAQASSGDGASTAQAMLGDSSPISDLHTPVSTPAIASVPPRVGKQRPLPDYPRLGLFPWMRDELLAMLGSRAVAFDLDAFLLRLDTSDLVLQANVWPWLKKQVEAEARRRGLMGPTSSPVHADYDAWPDECRRLHAGACGNYTTHQVRMAREAQAVPA